MAGRKKHSDRQWRRLQTRMAQAKRSQVDGRMNRAFVWSLILGALLVLAIHYLVNFTG
jgi:hypothetical protein